MKKTLMMIGMLSIAFSYAQEQDYSGRVGINTTAPNATLDVNGTPTDKDVLDGIIAPKITGDQLKAKTYTDKQTGALVYVTDAAATANRVGQTINVDEKGYYYFDGTAWQKSKGNNDIAYTAGNGVQITNGAISASNLYTDNGTLSSNRTITMSGRTLDFSGGRTSFINNAETISLKGTDHTYVGFYRNGTNRAGYLGYSGTSHTNFEIYTNVGNIKLMPSNNNVRGTTILDSKLQITELPVEHNASNALLVTDQNGNVKKANLYRAGSGISIDTTNNTISATNIYNGNGTLSSNRTVTMGDNTLNFSGGNVGINNASPSAKLDIATTEAGKGFKLADGTQGNGKVLTSDANGNATWQEVGAPTQIVNVQSIENFEFSGTGVKKTGLGISVPPGKWIYNIYLGVAHDASNTYKRGTTFVRLRFVDKDQNSGSVQASTLHPKAYGAKYASLGLGYSQTQGILVGALGINNDTNESIEAWLYADIMASNITYNGSGSANHGSKVSLLFKWLESTIIATKVQ